MTTSHPERAAAQTQVPVYSRTLRAYVPADQIGPDGTPLPIPEDVATEIRRIIEDDLEANPAARAIWIAEFERVAREQKGAA